MSAFGKLKEQNQAIGQKSESLSRHEFDYISKLIYEKAGINVIHNSKNMTLLNSRLVKVMRQRKIQEFREYIKFLKNNERNPKIIQELVNVLTTNTTYFFREAAHFDYMASFIPSYLKSRGDVKHPKQFRVWCAAASTGHEPYTIMIAALEAMASTPGIRLVMLATDIDTNVLKVAQEGVYEEADLEKVPRSLRLKYFEQKGPLFRVKEEYRKLICFDQLNLKQTPYKFTSNMDLIFCRNVMIYFRREDNLRITGDMANYLNPGGCLIIGHAETGLVDSPLLESQSQGVYRRKT